MMIRDNKTDYEAESLTLADLLSDAHPMTLQIPYYQRGYSWDQKHVKTFFDDLYDHIRSHRTENIPQYYFGYIITIDRGKMNDVQRYELVDGQQRITTSIILLTCIKDIYDDIMPDYESGIKEEIFNMSKQKGDDSHYKLILDNADNDFFRDHILKNHPKKIKTLKQLQKSNTNDKKLTESQNNLIVAYTTLREIIEYKLKEIVNEEHNTKYQLTSINKQQREFLNQLQNILRVKFVISNLDANKKSTAYTIFHRINDRGTQLAPADLAKELILSRIHEEHDKEKGTLTPKSAISKWNEMTKGLHNKKMIIQYIHHYLVTFHSEIKLESGQKNFKYIRNDKIFDAIESILKQKSTNGDPKITAGDLLDDMYDKFDNYKKICDNKLNFDVAWINKMGIIIVYPILMAGLERYPDNFDKLADIILKWFFNVKTIARQNATELEETLAKITNQIIEKNLPFAKFKHELIRSKHYVSGDALKKLLTLRKFSSTPAKYLLTKIVYADDKKQISDSVLSDKITLEHIMPKDLKPKSAKLQDAPTWLQYIQDVNKINPEDAEDLHRKYVGRLGNLTLTDESKNSLLNKPFLEKQKMYRKSNIEITRAIADEPKWDAEAIENRHTRLTMTAQKILEL